jgi:hypothetical protein
MGEFFRKLGVWSVIACFTLTGCVTDGQFGSGGAGGPTVGPQTSTQVASAARAPDAPAVARPRLDIVVPVFDPGLSDAARNYEEEGVWPDLRRAEANRFAHKLKLALEDTGAFDAVRVTPDSSASGDLYVLGTIVESNGAEVEIDVEVVDISGRRWFDRSFEHEVPDGFHKDVRNEGKDAYDPVFEAAAKALVEELDERDVSQLAALPRITELRFGASLSDAAFEGRLDDRGRTIDLVSFPADDDPMLRRVRAVRVRDQLFVDGLQENYRAFSANMQDSYLIWQEQSQLEMVAHREANERATEKAVLGVATIGIAVLAAILGAKSDSTAGQTAGITAATIGGVVGVGLLQQSFHTSEEAKVHREALEELGQSIDIDLAPRVIAFEKETVELTGNAREQFAQWRAFLQRIFEEEKTPAVQL